MERWAPLLRLGPCMPSYSLHSARAEQLLTARPTDGNYDIDASGADLIASDWNKDDIDAATATAMAAVSSPSVARSVNSARILPFLASDQRLDHITRLIVRSAARFRELYGDGGMRYLVFSFQLALATKAIAPLPARAHVRRALASAFRRAARWCFLFLQRQCWLRIDWGSAGNLLAVVRSTLCKSQLLCAVDDVAELERLGVLILRAFTSTVGSSTSSTDGDDSPDASVTVPLVVLPGCIADCELVPGLLLDVSLCTVGRFPTAATNSAGALSVALYDVALDALAPEQADALATALQAAGVRLVLCQRGIGQALARRMAQRGVAAVERLSIRHMDAVMRLTGAQPAADAHRAPDAAQLGRLGGWRRELHGHRTVLRLLAAPGCEFASLALYAESETRRDALVDAVRSALANLRTLLSGQARASPGAGATEVLMAAAVRRRSRAWLHRQRQLSAPGGARPDLYLGVAAQGHEAVAAALEAVAGALSPLPGLGAADREAAVPPALLIDSLRQANGLDPPCGEGVRWAPHVCRAVYGWDAAGAQSACCVARLARARSGLAVDDTHVERDCDAVDHFERTGTFPADGRTTDDDENSDGDSDDPATDACGAEAEATLLEPTALLQALVQAATDTVAALCTVGTVLVEPGATATLAPASNSLAAGTQ